MSQIFEGIDDELFFELSGLMSNGNISFIDKQTAILVGQIGFGRITPVLKHCSPTLKNDRELVLYIVSRNSNNLGEVKDQFRDDEEIIWSAIKRDGSAIKYASERLKDNDQIVEYLIDNSPRNIIYTSDRFSKNKDLILQLLKKDYKLFEHISHEMRNDLYVLQEFWKDIEKNHYTNEASDYHLYFFWEHLGDKAKPFFSLVENDGKTVKKQIAKAFEVYRQNIELKDELEKELNVSEKVQNKKVKI